MSMLAILRFDAPPSPCRPSATRSKNSFGVPWNLCWISLNSQTRWVQVASSQSSRIFGFWNSEAGSFQPITSQTRSTAAAMRSRMIFCSASGVAVGSVRMICFSTRGKDEFCRFFRTSTELICVVAWISSSPSISE